MTTTPAPMSPAPPLPDGVVPAPGARRLGAFLIDAVLITVAYYGITAVALAMGLASGSIETLMTMTTVSGLIVIALVAAMTAWLWTRGYTPGHRLLGLRWAAWDGAGPAGARSVGWYALAGLVGIPTLGIVPIITLLVTDPQGRNWIDRVCGTVVVAAGPGGAAAPRPGPVAVPGAAGAPKPPGAPRAAGPAPAFVEDTQEQPPLTASQLRDRLGAAATAGAASGPFAAPASAAAAAPEPIGDGPLFAPPPAPTGPAAAPGAGAAVSPPAPAVGAGFISSVPWETPAPAAAPAPAASAPSAPGAMPPVPPPPAARRLDRDRAAMPPVPPPPAVPEAAPAAAIDEGPTVARTALPRAGATLVMDTGQRIALVAPRTLLGRAPVAVPPWDKADTVPVIDPDRSISKTHLAVLLDGDRLSVRELGSTNGSAVVAADGARTTLLMGQDVVVPDGARVELGDRSFTVER